MSGYFPLFVFNILRLFGRKEEVKYIVGYVFSLIYGYFVRSLVVDGLRKKYGPQREGYHILPRITGVLDRLLYTSALITGIPGAELFIPMLTCPPRIGPVIMLERDLTILDKSQRTPIAAFANLVEGKVIIIEESSQI